MKVEKKIELIADLLEVEVDKLNPELELSDLPEWDSMAKLSLIVMIDDECGKKVSGNDIKKLVKLQDIIDLMD